MKSLFTISGRYAATEDASITPQVGYTNKINKQLYIYTLQILLETLLFEKIFFLFKCMK
jgi:hypothetical protein